MSKSKAQQFAQKRNSAGGLLKGIVKNLDNNILPNCCSIERDQVAEATAYLENVLECWSENYEQAKEENL